MCVMDMVIGKIVVVVIIPVFVILAGQVRIAMPVLVTDTERGMVVLANVVLVGVEHIARFHVVAMAHGLKMRVHVKPDGQEMIVL